ncbi:uncharacterized protein LOC116036881 [Sander lucioperca]|uniref:uncharacterized protein LOC116036881 n=1 Tax=Sander lucioperca TaxID=283035 RepID=UPI0016534C4C|nr:uncharacterized protein LOC116036881 [Sander lucioperca]
MQCFCESGTQPPDNSNVSTEHGPRPDEELTDVGPQSTDSSTLGDTLGAGLPCGSHCARFTSAGSIEAKRSCWSFDLHRDQEQVLRYVLDPKRPGHELIVRNNNICLTRLDFCTLGLHQQIESTIGNACFDMIKRIAVSKGKNVHIVDLYVGPTWLPPVSMNPMASIPSQAHQMDAIFIPLWTPGHYQICPWSSLCTLDSGVPGAVEWKLFPSVEAEEKARAGS